MGIQVWEYLDEYKKEKEEVYQAIDEVLNSGRLILGEHVKNFENEFAAYCGAKYGVGVNSATDALFLALRALDIGEGDEVITVSNTAVPTVSAIHSTGATVRFVDVDPKTYLMDVKQLEKALTKKTKCILPVHLYGQCVDMDQVRSIAERHNLFIIEDCAQSHGAKFRGQVCGSMSHISCFSFYPTKILGGFGDGGMCVTSDKKLDEKLRRLRFYGMEKTYYAIEHGYNSRLDELHAAILRKKFRHLDEYINRRRELAKNYDSAFSSTSLKLPVIAQNNEHAYYVYVVRHARREQLMEALKKRDVFCNISYPWPIHTMEGYLHLGYKEGDFPHTEAAAKEIFSLPMFPSLTDERQRQVIAAVHESLKEIE